MCIVVERMGSKSFYRVLTGVVFMSVYFLLTPYKLWAQEKKVAHTDVQALWYYNSARLSDRWEWATDLGYRWEHTFHERALYMARTGIGYHVTSGVRFLVGAAYAGSYANGRTSKVEWRPYQELTIKNAYPKVSLKHRFRVEERIFYKVSDGERIHPHTFHFRLRYAFTATIPLLRLSATNPDKKLSLSVGDEIQINAGNEIVTNIFNANRLYVGPQYQFNKRLSVSLQWYNEFASTSTAGQYKDADIMWLKVKQKIDLSRKAVH